MLKGSLTFLLCCILATQAIAQDKLPYVQGCTIPDSVEIEDVDLQNAVLTYLNSPEDCSQNTQITMKTPNGVEVRVIVTVGGKDKNYKETVTVIPVDPRYMSIPEELELIDGEYGQFLITPGIG